MTWNKTLKLSFVFILIGIFSNAAFSAKVLEGYVVEDRTII